MADNRKSFRPRRLAFGGRLSLPRCLVGASLVLCAAFGSAQAQDAGLKNGAKALSDGKYDNAVRLLTSTVNSDQASTSDAARALYLRGIANRKLGETSQAIADLGAALWLGLPASERVRAQVNRGLAYRSAGLSSQAEAEFTSARKASSSSAVDKLIAEDGAGDRAAIAAFATEVQPNDQYQASSSSSAAARARAEPPPDFGPSVSQGAPAPKPPPRRTANASPDWSTSVSEESAEAQSGNRVSRWFGSLTNTFGSSEEEPAEAPRQPEPPPAPRTAAAPPIAPPQPAPPAAPAAAPAPSSWTTQTSSAEAASGSSESGTRFGRWLARRTGSDSEPAPQAQAQAGAYRLQLTTSRSEAEAKALWQKVSRENRQFAAASPEIERVDIGDFGTFYSLKIGPFTDKAESLKLCNALKRSGVDCSLVAPDAQ